MRNNLFNSLNTSNQQFFIILLFQGVVLEIVAPVAVFGLGMVWLCGWRQGRQLFERFCEEELASLEYERTREVEETIEDAVRRAIRERSSASHRPAW